MNLTEKSLSGFKNIIITLDGTAGSGKSTTASILADRLNMKYLNTGSMYRAVTYAVLKEGIDPEDERKVSELAGRINLELVEIDGERVLFLDGENIEQEIRKSGVSAAVSPVSRHESVRTEMVKLQRKIAGRGGVVAEGRDLGTVVFPHAQVKLFLIADIEARVRRRSAQLRSMGIDQDEDKVRKNIEERDRIDSTRQVSPLLKPPGAKVIDTSGLTIDQQVRIAEDYARGRLKEIIQRDKYYLNRKSSLYSTRYYRITRKLIYCIFKLLFGLRVYGRENLRTGGNFIFASNHISYSDPPVVGSILNREVWFLAKKELFNNRFFGWLISKYHAVPIDRDSFDRAAIRKIVKLLKSGSSILMFPEGTRSKDDRIRMPKMGLGYIAVNSGTDIIPVYISGSNRMGRAFLRKNRLEVHIGPPIYIDSGYKSDDRKRDYKLITSMFYESIKMLKYGT